MLIGIAGFAVWCALTTALPSAFSQALIGLVWITSTGVIVTGLFFAEGDQRAFCIGASVVVSSMWTRIGGRFLQGVFQIFSLITGGLQLPEAMGLWLDLALIALVAALNGWLCMRARSFFEKP